MSIRKKLTVAAIIVAASALPSTAVAQTNEDTNGDGKISICELRPTSLDIWFYQALFC